MLGIGSLMILLIVTQTQPSQPGPLEELLADFEVQRAQHAYMAANPWTQKAYYGFADDPDAYVERQLSFVALYDQRSAAARAAAAGDCEAAEWLLADLYDGRSQHVYWIEWFAANPDLAAQASEASLQSYWVAVYDGRIAQLHAITPCLRGTLKPCLELGNFR